MEITGIRTYTFSVPTGSETHDPHTGQLLCSLSKPWLFLKIETDKGICGWGEGTGEWLVPSVEATLLNWSELLVGQDPLRPRALVDDIANRIPWKGGPVFGTALAAIDLALHDLAGRAWGAPAHALLGGRQRHRVRVYSGIDLSSPQQAVHEALAVRDAGYAAVKGNPLETRSWPMDHRAIAQSIACVEAIREAVGPDFDILLDAHGSPSPELSIAFARQVEPYRPLFFEEPVKVGSLDALIEVSRKSPVPVATGEKLFTAAEFKPLIDARACAFLQPDIAHCQGLATYAYIARMAADAQILMAPHNAGGPLCLAASLHAAAATPNFLIQEMNHVWFDTFHRYVEHGWTVADGHIAVDDAPGFGIEVKEQDLARLACEPLPYRQYRHSDGSWKGW